MSHFIKKIMATLYQSSPYCVLFFWSTKSQSLGASFPSVPFPLFSAVSHLLCAKLLLPPALLTHVALVTVFACLPTGGDMFPSQSLTTAVAARRACDGF